MTRERLGGRGIRTIGELAEVSPGALQGLLGDAAGARLSALAHDDDPRKVSPRTKAKSVGAQSALGRRPATDDVFNNAFARLADRVASRLRAACLEGRTVTVRVRFPGMRSVTRSATLATPVTSTRALTEIATFLAAGAVEDEGQQEVTLVAVSVSHLRRADGLQLALPFKAGDGGDAAAARWAIDRSVDAVRARFGRGSVGYAPVVLGGAGLVPDDFRELAERDLSEAAQEE